MIFKIYYQDTKIRNPKREDTHSMYLEADSEPEAWIQAEGNTEFNIEYIEELSDKALEYEKQNPDFKIAKF